MSNPSPVTVLLAKLSKCSPTISAAYFDTRLHKTEENTRDVEMLRHFRLLSPDIRDAYRLRGSFRQFLNTALSTDRLYAIGANIGGYFERLSKLIDEHAYAFHEGRDADCERYEAEIREAISDVADALDDDLTLLQVQVSTKFAAVPTIAEKRRQNLHYQDRTQKLVDLLENFHFAGFGDQLAGNEELALSFRALLEDRLPAFRESLKTILQQLNQYLFEFRKIEERAKCLRSFSLHLARHPDWSPLEWDEVASPPEWVRMAKPLQIAAHPDTRQPENESLLRELALSIPSSPGIRMDRRPPGTHQDDPAEPQVVIAKSPIRRAVRAFVKAAASDGQTWLSARAWWLQHPVLLAGVREDIWLLRVLSEGDKQGKGRDWKFHVLSAPHPEFSGNLIIHDIMASARSAGEYPIA